MATGLPIALSEPRRAASERLCGAASEIASAVTKFRSAADALGRACAVLNGMASKRRGGLARAMAAHEAACTEADRIEEMQVRLCPYGATCMWVGSSSSSWGGRQECLCGSAAGGPDGLRRRESGWCERCAEAGAAGRRV